MKRSVCSVLLISILLLLQPFDAAGQEVNDSFKGALKKYVVAVLDTFHVPGMSVAIVKDGERVLAKGYGIKEMGKGEEVDKHTLFPVASNTKAFTATALGLLVESGELGWDQPVIKYLPWFRMGNPYVTKHLTVRDLLVHRSGLSPYAGDLLWFPNTDYSRREIAHKIQYLPLDTSFRSGYAYDNVLYMVAGVLIEEVSGQPWEAFVQERILKPLEMNGSINRISTLVDRPNRAAPHARIDGELRPIQGYLDWGLNDATNPAGGIASNAVDMSRWMITQLDSGRVATGQRLFKPETTEELWSGVTPMDVEKVPESLEPSQSDFNLYGLGFRISDYRSYKTVTHRGVLEGFVSRVMLVPDLNLGISILTNQESKYAIRAILNHILDYYMEAPEYNWIAPYKMQEEEQLKKIKATERQTAAERDTTSTPSLPLSEYAGTYYDKWYGKVTVELEGDHLVMRFTHTPEMVGDMEYWQYDSFIVRWRNRDLNADAYVNYSLNEAGTVDRIKMKAISPATDISYDFRDLLLKPDKKN